MKNDNYEDFASGRVIYHKSGLPNFPVRLAGEIFQRALSYLEKDRINLYDPCCGNAYLLTVLGLLNYNKVKQIIASDIDIEALKMARINLSLLTEKGLLERKKQIENMLKKYGKPSHNEALKSIERFLKMIKTNKEEIDIRVFQSDILNKTTLEPKKFNVDMVITDVPYGNLVTWSDDDSSIMTLLEHIKVKLNKNAVVAVITNKKEKMNHRLYKRIEKFKIGKRYVYIFSYLNKGEHNDK